MSPKLSLDQSIDRSMKKCHNDFDDSFFKRWFLIFTFWQVSQTDRQRGEAAEVERSPAGGGGDLEKPCGRTRFRCIDWSIARLILRLLLRLLLNVKRRRQRLCQGERARSLAQPLARWKRFLIFNFQFSIFNFCFQRKADQGFFALRKDSKSISHSLSLSLSLSLFKF